ncbi:MAG: hypothetical protein MSB01_05885, partial [Bacteroidales bacterium]|nr:hypothetical protein [Bacteroidales bacterium]
TLSIPENAKIIRLKGDLLHYSNKNITDHIARIDKYSSLTAQEAHKKVRKATFAKIMLRPAWKYVREYIFQAGNADGYSGFQICTLSAIYTFWKYAKLRELNKSDKSTF